MEYRIAHRSGTVFWVSDTIKSVRHPDGRMWAYAVATDIQQRQNRLEDYEKLGDALPCGVAIFDYCEGQIRLGYSNQAMWRFTGLSERQFAERINAGVYGMLHREDVPQVRSRVAKLAAGANAANCTVRVNTKYGQRFILLVMRVMQRTEPCFRISLMAIDVTRYHKAPEPERHALENISAVTYPGPYVRTFGFFNVFLGGQAVPFHHQKAKELLALLVDQRGGFIGPEEIISRLWEDDPVDKNTLARCRKTFMQLRDDLEAAGVGDIVESDRSLRRVIPEKIGCDLYDFLSGKPQYMGLFKGEYLSNYSWSEYTLASLLEGAYPA